MTPTIPLSSGLALAAWSALDAMFREAAARIDAWREARRTTRALTALDDHVLHDLGLDRSEVPSLAAELAGDVERERIHALRTLLPR
jgi:uncharacterized protein YjiS (DUF1127 family)